MCAGVGGRVWADTATHVGDAVEFGEFGEMKQRCGRDVAEIGQRCGRDRAEMWQR